MRIAFIAVNYNKSDISINYVLNVKAIRGYALHDIKIIMVDNCSEINDYDNLKQGLDNEESVILVRTEKNLGYFGGLNFGIKQIEDVYKRQVIHRQNLSITLQEIRLAFFKESKQAQQLLHLVLKKI